MDLHAAGTPYPSPIIIVPVCPIVLFTSQAYKRNQEHISAYPAVAFRFYGIYQHTGLSSLSPRCRWNCQARSCASKLGRRGAQKGDTRAERAGIEPVGIKMRGVFGTEYYSLQAIIHAFHSTANQYVFLLAFQSCMRIADVWCKLGL